MVLKHCIITDSHALKQINSFTVVSGLIVDKITDETEGIRIDGT